MATEQKDESEPTLVENHGQTLSKTQQKRLEMYKSLGTTSKTKVEQKKFDAKYNALYQKSFMRRKKMDQMSMYEQFAEILSARSSKTLNPSNFLDFLASIITIYIGQNQTVLISKHSSNNFIDGSKLNITGIDMLIPYQAPRDKITYTIPRSISRRIATKKGITFDEKKPDIKCDLSGSYAFGALPDQRLFRDDKCRPYIMNDEFQWTILYGSNLKPATIVSNSGRSRSAFEKIVGAAVISDGVVTYCIYGTRKGLFYNQGDREFDPNPKRKKLIDARVDGIFRQNDYLFVLCSGPVLYNISLTTKTREIAVNQILKTRKTYDFCSFKPFVGGYYDAEKDILIAANNEAEVYIFENGGKIDGKFNTNFNIWRRKELRVPKDQRKLEKGNLCYFDVDRNAIIYIGTKTVLSISLDKNKQGNYSRDLVKMMETKWFLKGYNFDCKHFLYIYHQKTLVVLKKTMSSANCPYILQIYVDKSLRFS